MNCYILTVVNQFVNLIELKGQLCFYLQAIPLSSLTKTIALRNQGTVQEVMSGNAAVSTTKDGLSEPLLISASQQKSVATSTMEATV